ncbi:hypothetical protein SAMN05518848_105216 [Paenibacillus sp. PDC88]|nr:hypothetical protein SAMN05518848_105216 [Paenibacillus sp. PDC88]
MLLGSVSTGLFALLFNFVLSFNQNAMVIGDQDGDDQGGISGEMKLAGVVHGDRTDEVGGEGLPGDVVHWDDAEAVVVEVFPEDEGHSDLADGAGIDVVPAEPAACSVIPAMIPEDSVRLAQFDSLPLGPFDPDSSASISAQAHPMQPYISSAD